MKYLATHERGHRGSKNNLTRGAFGTSDARRHNFYNVKLKVIKKSLRTKENCNKSGVANV